MDELRWISESLIGGDENVAYAPDGELFGKVCRAKIAHDGG